MDQKKDTSRVYDSKFSSIVDLVIIAALTLTTYLMYGLMFAAIGFVIFVIIIFFLSFRIINQWNKMPVLRFGNYRGMIGPGLYLIMPFVDSTPSLIDTRVISTTFTAEKTLTKDNVPVDVDAILFWKVHNPESSILNVQDYYNSVLLASQTAMRDVIGKKELSLMLAGRDIIGKDIQDLIQQRIMDWGITAISVEIRDVKIPADLQSAMARVATSDREKQSRVILAESESLAADKMLEAAKKYEKDPFAMQLRSLNMMYEISITGKNVMVFIPTESKGFSIPTPFGVSGLTDYLKQNAINLTNELKEQKKKSKPKEHSETDSTS